MALLILPMPAVNWYPIQYNDLMALTIGMDLLAASLSVIRSPLGRTSLLLLTAVGIAVAWGREAAWNMPPRIRWQVGWWAALTVLFSSLLNWGILALLPRLGLSFGALGIGQFGLNLLTILVLLAAAAAHKIPSRRGWVASTPASLKKIMLAAWLVQAFIYILAVYSLYFAPFNLQTTHLAVPAPHLLLNRPLRILQISDLHIERLTPREEKALVQVQELQPDLIVLTGDYLNLDYLEDPLSLAEARRFLSQLHAPYGTFAVSGTVDSPRLMDLLFTGIPITVLHDQIHTIALPGENLHLVGVSFADPTRDGQVLTNLVEQVPNQDFSLLLYHTPDLAETAAALGIDLYLAGHTHGGQVRLPLYGAVVTFSSYGKRFEAGAYTLDHTQLYVSRGLGMEGFGMPRIRFLCPPELVLVEIGNPKP